MLATLNAASVALIQLPLARTTTPAFCCGKCTRYVRNDAHEPLCAIVGRPRCVPCETPNAYGFAVPSFSGFVVLNKVRAALPATVALSKLINHFAKSSTLLNMELEPNAVRLFGV